MAVSAQTDPDAGDPALAAFLGFEVGFDGQPIEIIERVVTIVETRQVETGDFGALLREKPRAVLFAAMKAIFHVNGNFREVVEACCDAQRKLASQDGYRESIRRQGWIVGKPADDPSAKGE